MGCSPGVSGLSRHRLLCLEKTSPANALGDGNDQVPFLPVLFADKQEYIKSLRIGAFSNADEHIVA